MKARNILIVGGGIAGLTAARFLSQGGHKITVIERARDFSAQGHAIGFRGVGFQVLDRLGLKAAAEACGRGYVGARSFTFAGEPLRSSTTEEQAEAVGGVVVTHRGRLHAILANDLPAEIDLRFGLAPTAIEQDGDKATVKLSDGSEISCDLVVGADGANSIVRRLVMPDLTALDYGGIYAGLTVHCEHDLPLDKTTTYFGKARMVGFFPITSREVSIVLYQDDQWPAPPAGTNAEEWGRYFRRGFDDLAPAARRILGSLKAGDSIFWDRIRQIPAKRVTTGRTVLVGDSGYCPTFFSGNGAALACLGAFVLSECLKNNDDDIIALYDYQKRIIPQAVAYQENANKMKKVLFARNPLIIIMRQLVLKYSPNFMMNRTVKKHYRGELNINDIIE